jgi:hypothetical protein
MHNNPAVVGRQHNKALVSPLLAPDHDLAVARGDGRKQLVTRLAGDEDPSYRSFIADA